MSNTTSTTPAVFDGRELPCEIKRPAFLARCVDLPVGQSFLFVNGHDPVPLRQHLDQLYPGCFRWELRATAPELVHLHVTKTAAPADGFRSETAAVRCH